MLKTKRIGLIVTDQEKGWVVQLAKLEGGLSQASLIRRLIHQAAVRHFLFNPETPSEIEREKKCEQTSLEGSELGCIGQIHLGKSNL